ncbi:hypothetical protein THAOC_28948 [Thalassiosira oceanica]|uniref:MYND-type domain-containing protein n=1 Tax=Thalassiosira oceanica TaxID=159749 RepID=K0RF33_THAOC|nr:hypothetical protein THAOC_28948 [Thalassiosira oceanica]|eukprot:EJK51845.1 hypothetical protein THAOC_28948 [Thalassiosira oceanica]
MKCEPVNRGDDCKACANCDGKLGSDAVKLKNCTACRLVEYCGVDCQRARRKQHKKACKQSVAELKDEQLYLQSGTREAGGGLLSDLHSPDPVTDGRKSTGFSIHAA